MTLSNSSANGLEQTGRWISKLHRLHFRCYGYMITRNVIPGELVANAVREITSFLGAWRGLPGQLDPEPGLKLIGVLPW